MDIRVEEVLDKRKHETILNPKFANEFFMRVRTKTWELHAKQKRTQVISKLFVSMKNLHFYGSFNENAFAKVIVQNIFICLSNSNGLSPFVSVMTES
jgi:hypothetical protein